MQKPIADATATELRDFARIHLGLDVHHSCSAATVRAKMLEAGFAQDFITVEEAEPVVVETVTAPVTGKMDDPWNQFATILIPATEQDKEPVFVSVNNRDARIKRGVQVKVPMPYIGALRDAVEAIYDVDENGNIVEEPRMVPKIPFQVLA